jgi:hypothetical protein
METKEQYLLRVAEEWNGGKMRELKVLEYMCIIKDNYEMGLISVEEFADQNMELLRNLKKNLL